MRGSNAGAELPSDEVDLRRAKEMAEEMREALVATSRAVSCLLPNVCVGCEGGGSACQGDGRGDAGSPCCHQPRGECFCCFGAQLP